jgi:hypothetical protein
VPPHTPSFSHRAIACSRHAARTEHCRHTRFAGRELSLLAGRLREPLGDGGRRPPAELVELTRVHTLGAELAPVAELTTHRRRWRLAGADKLAELVDDYAVARWES